MNQLDTDIYWLREAYIVASTYSHDPYVQNGAILIKEGKKISFGANKFPNGVKETEERWRYPLKSYYVSHAEDNAILNAGHASRDATMYCPWFACDRCANTIITAGIKEIVGHSAPDIWYEPHRKYENGKPVKSIWDESIEHGLIKMKEAGVKLRWLHEEIGGVSIIFMGERVCP
ncbi:MAG: deaminase [Nanoarchaeota archaeon]